MNEYGDNGIIEISNDTEKNDNKENTEILNIPPKKKSFKDKWNDLSKGSKIGIIVGIVLVVLLIGALVLYFLIFKKYDNTDANVPKKDEVVLEKDNYRYENGSLVFLNINEKEIGTYECTNKDSNACYVAKLDYSKDAFDRITSVDKNGKELEKNSQIYYDKYVFVKDGEELFFYNITSKEKDLKLKTIKTYGTAQYLVVIEDDANKYGLLEIDESGYKYLIRPSYNYLGIVNNTLSYLVAQDLDKTYIIDSNGKKISEDINGTVKSLNDDYITVYKDNAYNLYNYDGEEIITDYNFMAFHDELISLVKGNRLYLMDNNLNKLYEDGLRLESSDYVKKYVYENNLLVETKNSYEVDSKGDKTIVKIGNTEKEINNLEGLISSNYAYLSYYDGKLYFYSDELKQDLIGDYSCINKNTLESSISSFDNCHLYSKDNLVSGIYNNEYVFIYDGSSSENAKIYLYSLKEKKTKGTYSDIQFVSDKEMSEDIKPYYTSSTLIIAKSDLGANAGNYGILEITSNNVTGKVPFKYKSLENNYGYYLMQNVDNTYTIFDKNFNEVSNSFAYIAMYENYYVGINNSELNVYSYDSKTGILNDSLSIMDNNYTIDFTDGFNITIQGITYRFDGDGNVKDGE